MAKSKVLRPVWYDKIDPDMLKSLGAKMIKTARQLPYGKRPYAFTNLILGGDPNKEFSGKVADLPNGDKPVLKFTSSFRLEPEVESIPSSITFQVAYWQFVNKCAKMNDMTEEERALFNKLYQYLVEDEINHFQCFCPNCGPIDNPLNRPVSNKQSEMLIGVRVKCLECGTELTLGKDMLRTSPHIFLPEYYGDPKILPDKTPEEIAAEKAASVKAKK